MDRETYILAVKRSCREQAPPDWQHKLEMTSGIKVISATDRMLEIRASDDAIARLRSAFGQWLNIEKPIMHQTQMA